MLSPAQKGAVAVAADSPRGSVVRLTPEILLVGLVVLAAVLRFATLTSQSYWFDEAQAAHEMGLSFGGLLSTLGNQETSPPLYFVLAWLWAKLFGAGEAGLRSLSALAGLAVIPITYLCARELVSRWAGVVAAGLAAICPFLIWYSQEAREYMLLAALCGASFLFFARALHRPSRGNLVAFTVCSALALLTHFFAGFLVAPEALWLVLAWRARARERRGALLAAAALVVVEAALAPLAVSDTSHPIGWLTAFPLSTRIEQVPVTFAFGTLYRSSIVNYGLLGAGVVAAVVLFLLISGASRRELRGAGIAAALAGCVILLPLLFALAGHDFYIARALMPAWIPLAVVLGAAATAQRSWPLGVAGAAALAAAMVLAQVRIDDHPQYQRPDWRAIAAALGAAAQPRAIAIFEGSLALDPLKLYLPRVPWQQPAGPVAISELDVIGSAFQTPALTPPPGLRLIAQRRQDGYLLARFRLERRRSLTPAQIAASAGALLSPPAGGADVLVQPAA